MLFFSTRPATASSFLNKFGIALVGRGDERGVEHVLDAERRRCALRPELRRHALDQRARLVGIGEQDLDHLLDRDVVVVRDASNRNRSPWRRWHRAAPPRARAWLRASRSCRSRRSPRSDRDCIRRAWRIAALPWRDRCRRSCMVDASLRRRLRPARPRASGTTGCAIETWATKPRPKKLFSRAKVRSMNWSAMHEMCRAAVLR